MARATYGYPSRAPHQRFRRDQMPARYWTERVWQFSDEDQTRFSDAFLLWNCDQALRNLDLSLAYVNTLDTDEFETALTDETKYAVAVRYPPADYTAPVTTITSPGPAQHEQRAQAW